MTTTKGRPPAAKVQPAGSHEISAAEAKKRGLPREAYEKPKAADGGGKGKGSGSDDAATETGTGD